ncbi:discoidin domain-containing protein [Streptomyces pratensis]|uniref:discoidin domain-containing protein n=1 Tax=Streptomyces pratensis TaxID=1169025 RepID=UPI00301A780B
MACPNCRTRNAPDRTLCVRCALVLDPGPAPAVRPPWWRRLLRRRPRSAPAAGTRPRRGWRRPRVGLPIVLVLLAVGVWFALPYLPGLFGLAQQETGTPEAVPPATCRGSSEADGHPAAAAVDGFNNRYWAPKEAGGGVGEHLECDFAQPVRLLKIVVFAGTSARQDEFLTQGRPARITVELTSKDGERAERTIRLRDQAGQQTFDVRGKGTVRARLTVASSYGAGEKRRTAVAEVEFFGRRE